VTRNAVRSVLLCLVISDGCGSSSDVTAARGKSDGVQATPQPSGDPFDIPVNELSAELVRTFDQGDRLFDLPLREYDGLGPRYTRNNCGACHAEGVRGPGLVQKMAIVEPDGVTPASDQSELAYGHTVHPLMTAGAMQNIMPPSSDPNVKVTIRVGPPVLGRGYLEAVLDSEIERMEREQADRSDAIHGRVNHVIYASEANPDTRFHQHQKGDSVIGRFGLKARVATLDDFTADALQGDMGITSPLRPDEFANPDGLTDDLKVGTDVGIESVNQRAMYIRLTAIPKRVDAADARGRQLFADTRCGACHVPALKTRADYPIALIAGIDAPVYTDVLLHDMGDALADGIVEGGAGPRDWRTAPLIGLRFNKSFLHDGRAHDVDGAIRGHASAGSEANDSVARYEKLDETDRRALDAFVGAL
jgi:CxxC motif-containing protein (DUF1111 family)